jgi:hypothetical protein
MAQPHVEVQAGRVLIGAEFVPRFVDLPDKLVVGAGQTVTLPTEGTFSYIEVAGTLAATARETPRSRSRISSCCPTGFSIAARKPIRFQPTDVSS